MNSLPGFNDFCCACSTVFDSKSSSSRRREADNWLTNFQRIPEAWAVADNVLSCATNNADVLSNDESQRLQVVFLAAKTLRTKLLYDYDQISVADRIPLREKVGFISTFYYTTLTGLRIS